jgi:hypothetical protein
MTNYLLDTTEIIDYGRGHPPTVVLLNNLHERGNSLGCCDVVIAEVYAGVKEKDRDKIEELVEALRFYPAEKEIGKLAGQYINDFSQRGIQLTVADALIAAVAISYQLVLITKNQKHYPMSEIKLYQP